MTHNTSKKSFDGIRVVVGGRTFHPRHVGGVDMLVDPDGALLALSLGGGERRLPDGADLLRLSSHGVIRVLPAVDPAVDAAQGPLRSVRVIPMARKPMGLRVAQPARVATGAERHGPASPVEMADHVASTMVVQPILHRSVSARAAHLLYLEAMAELNDRLGRHAVEPLCARYFQRRIAVARFLAENPLGAGVGATIH